MTDDLAIAVNDESLVLLTEGALYWPAKDILLAADLHLGKAAAFRNSSIPVPLGETSATLEKLSGIVNRLGPQRLVLLGDLWHSSAGMTEKTLSDFQTWRALHTQLDITLVLGNHDRRISGYHLETADIPCLPSLSIPPFLLCHEPCEREKFAICGHIHPAVRLRRRALGSMVVPCFWFTERFAVLPALGSFTGVSVIRPKPEDRVFLAPRLHKPQVGG